MSYTPILVFCYPCMGETIAMPAEVWRGDLDVGACTF